MAKTLQLRRGTTAELSSVTGSVGELFVDTTKDTVVVMDGSTPGGFPLVSIVDGGITVDEATIGNVLITDDIITPIAYDVYGTPSSGDGILTINGNLDITGELTANVMPGWVYLTEFPQDYQLQKNTRYIGKKEYTGDMAVYLPANSVGGDFVEIIISNNSGFDGAFIIATSGTYLQESMWSSQNSIYGPRLFGEHQMTSVGGENRNIFYIWDVDNIPSGKEAANMIHFKFVYITDTSPPRWVVTV